ncbi:hypothetical protein AWB81_01797 [Caballeronia arationis]|uniref:hypothetical protein n=1 Tax=Caballeronia arationis TaxID=1777142 RepID=UPI00074B7EA9|nr:hypothetical protein [Caballeronia arationis]SAK59133.1 hypothetical protein AWB81_01797 [Caballeronia arationis]
MTPNLYRYPLDKTGQSKDNYVTGDAHAIGTDPVRAIAPNYGAFFASSMEIVDSFTQKQLDVTQYQFQFLHEQASSLVGQEIYGVVVITDPTVGPNVELSYQALGGEYSRPIAAIATEVATLANDNRSVKFANITDLPDTFTPVLHMHAVGDTYNWDYVVSGLEMILNAMTLIKASSYDSTLNYLDQQAALRNADIANLAQALAAHIANENNPHQVTLAQVDVYSAAQVSSLIASEASARTAGDATLTTNITAHATRTDNPHQVTAAQAGGYTSAQADSNLSSITTALNTTLSTDAAAMSAHIANKSNPHLVTLTQIDGQTTAQINTTISNAMSPVTTQLNADEATMNAHIANTSNPHQVTLTQINGWDSASIGNINSGVAGHVGNGNNPHQVTTAQVGTLTAAQINNNIANNFTTPAQVSYLNPQTNWINSHIYNYSNPHNVTVAQLGGWTYAQWQSALATAVYNLSYH